MGIWDILTSSHSLYLIPTELVIRLQEPYYIDSFQWPIGGDRPISGVPLNLMTYRLVPPAVMLITPQPNFADSTHKGTTPCDWSLQLFPWKVCTKGLVPGTCSTNSLHKVLRGTSHRDLSQKFKLVWIYGTSRRDQSWSLQLDF